MTTPSQTQTITIQDINFEAPQPYAAGHTLSEVEAGVLNQALAENLRNNFAKKVKDARAGLASTDSLSAEKLATLKAEFDSYAGSYVFKAKGAPRQPLDPIQREAEKIATGLLNAALNKKGSKRADLPEGRWELLLAEVAAKPTVRAEAERRVAAAKSVAADALVDLPE